jgi:orotidine-5'-phosphate decarboxylase
MNANQLFKQIKEKQSYLCIGLDTDYDKIPKILLDSEYPLFEFNKRIINATADLAVAFKPNIAFYESMGASGQISLEMTVNFIRSHFPEIFIIADAKRGDIGNTSRMYATAFFKTFDFDAITVSPYMGNDSVKPFLDFPERWIILLALTSNEGAEDFQFQRLTGRREHLFERVIRTSMHWGTRDNMMYVVGATKAMWLKKIRRIIPDHFLLIPGIGAQGGSLEQVSKAGLNSQCGLLVNVSRGIIYSDITDKFDESARSAALLIQSEMAGYLAEAGLI